MSAIDEAFLQLTKCPKCVGCELLGTEGFRGKNNCAKFVPAAVDMEALKQQYNEKLKKFKGLAAYMDNPDKPQEKKESGWARYLEVQKEMNEIVRRFDAYGIEYTEKEILEGFG
jgi:uncharacterized protein (DUF427 family)